MKTCTPWLFALLIISGTALQAQLSEPGTPKSFLTKSLTDALPTVILPAIDRGQVDQQDQIDEENGLPPRFGFPHEVKYTLENSGIWEEFPGGGRVWRLKVSSPGALSLNFCYSDWFMPAGGEFYVYSANRRHVIGAFTERNNKQDGGFATGLVYGDEVILEYYEPESAYSKGSMTISLMVHGYRFITDMMNSDLVEEVFGSSGACQVNVNCTPEGTNWQDEKRGVAMIIAGGFRWCSGSLINTTRDDCSPYFLTAHHCRDGYDAVTNPNMNTWTFYWMYESPGCSDGSDFTPPSTNGGVMRANDVPSDFALIWLNESPADIPGVNPYFNGWDATASPGSGGVGIHHPAGDIKKIATHSSVPASDTWYGTPGTHWSLFWNATPNGHSVTEGGSSGSPLFNSNKRIIGQLHGGSSINCSNPSADIGIYGAINYSLNNAGATDNRRKLSPWLDPDGSGATSVNGSYGDCSSGCFTPSGLNVGSVTTSSAVLSWSASTGALTYSVRHRAVGAPVWINASTASTSLNISGLSECTQYEFQVAANCEAGLTSFFSLSFLFTSDGCPCPEYCLSGGGTVDEFIQSVQIGDLVNVSGNNGGYANFTGTSATANYDQGSTYSLTLTPGYTGTVYGEWFRVYIDYNQDGDFLDAGELAYDAGGTVSGVPATGSITIPASALSGSTGLRVVMIWNSAPNSCGTVTYGETEDYCITIGSDVECSTDSPPQNPAAIVGGSSVALSWTAVPLSAGCQVQASRISPTGPTGTRNIVGFEADNTILPFSLLGSGTTWQWRVRCACSLSPLTATAFSAYNNFSIPVFRSADWSDRMGAFPNPADQQLQVQYESLESGQITIELVDMLGRIALRTMEYAESGVQSFSLNTADLPSGHYQLRVIEANGLGTIPIHIEHSGF